MTEGVRRRRGRRSGAAGVICAAGVVVAVAVLAGVGRAHATGLDPFRRAGALPIAAPSPFRLAQAAATKSAPPAAAPAPRACARDEECASDRICEDGICQAIPQRTNILYLYYRDGSVLQSFGLYWSQRRSPGLPVVL